MRKTFTFGFAALALSASAFAQNGQPPSDAGQEQLNALVLEVKRGAYFAPVGTKPEDQAAWTPIKVNDQIPPGSQIQTGIWSELLLQLGDDTLVHIDNNSLASLDQLYIKDGVKTTRLAVGRGKLTAGVAEGDVRSDLTIDAGVATLSKRGTWGFGVFKGRDGFVDFYLRDRGLVDIMFKQTGQRRLLMPGQFVTSKSIRQLWVTQARFDRVVSMYDLASKTNAELNYGATGGNSGLGVVSPAAGVETNQLTGRNQDTQALALDQLEDDGALGQMVGNLLNRPEGNFGFGDVPPGFNGQLGKRLRDRMGGTPGSGDMSMGDKVNPRRRFVGNGAFREAIGTRMIKRAR